MNYRAILKMRFSNEHRACVISQFEAWVTAAHVALQFKVSGRTIWHLHQKFEEHRIVADFSHSGLPRIITLRQGPHI